jgi:hypothetical protein
LVLREYTVDSFVQCNGPLEEVTAVFDIILVLISKLQNKVFEGEEV